MREYNILMIQWNQGRDVTPKN